MYEISQLNCLIWFFFFLSLRLLSGWHQKSTVTMVKYWTSLQCSLNWRYLEEQEIKKAFISFTVSMVYVNIKIFFNLKRSSSTVHSWHKHLLAIKCLICCYLFFFFHFFPHISSCIIFGMNKEESENQPVLSH